MSTLQDSEHLQEVLLHLEQTRRQEKKLREESDAILNGLSALVGADSREKILSILQETFHKLIDYKDCWIMQQLNDRLVTDMNYVSFPVGKGLSRVLNGRVLNAFDVKKIPEWECIESDICSALHLPLQLSRSKGILILTSTKPAAFTRESIELAQRIIPFSEQAIAKIELIESAHAKEIEEQRKLMRLILDHSPFGVWLLNRNKQIMFVNKTFCNLLGISESRFMQTSHYAKILPEFVGTQCIASDDACFDSGDLVNTRKMIQCVDGEEHVFDITKVPVKSTDGETSSIIGIAVDITEQLKSADEKEQMQQQLLHAQKLESLGVLAGGIAHDFNNILTAIMGHASIAKNKIADDPTTIAPHLQTIVASSERAADLCKQMLAYSGQGKFIVKPLNLSQLIISILDILEVSLNKSIALKLSLPEDIPMIEADATQIQQIAMNLITNANEAIGTDNGEISIQTGIMHADNNYLKQCLGAEKTEAGHYTFIEVTDTGCGMNGKIISKIFDPFFTTKFTGRGLGMSAVLGIVQGHHGALSLTSSPGQGTTFRVLFPALDYNSISEVESEYKLPDATKKPVLLVVDDEEIIRAMTSAMVLEAGFNEALIAADGKEALETYAQEKNNIDIVLLDLTMPNMDGEETLYKLREINPDIKVILSSGYSEQSIKERFEGKGLCGFLQKPYALDTLKQIINKALI